jgi:hypothetical protein
MIIHNDLARNRQQISVASFLLIVLFLLVCFAIVAAPAVVFIRKQAADERRERAMYARDIEEIGGATTQYAHDQSK